jgi:hypothetical protein
VAPPTLVVEEEVDEDDEEEERRLVSKLIIRLGVLRMSSMTSQHGVGKSFSSTSLTKEENSFEDLKIRSIA